MNGKKSGKSDYVITVFVEPKFAAPLGPVLR